MSIMRRAHLADLQMIAHLEVELGHGAALIDHREVVFATDRGVHVDDVGQCRDQTLQFLLVLAGLLLGILDRGRQFLGPGQQGKALIGARGGHLAAQILLLCPHALKTGQRCAMCLVGSHRPLHEIGILAPADLRDADLLGLVAQKLRVNHDSEGIGRDLAPEHLTNRRSWRDPVRGRR